jgi:hypothetical protein
MTWCCEDHRKNWASYEEVKDWRFCHGFQNCEESWIRRWLSIEKPQLFFLVKSRSSINYSKVFAKDRHSFAMWVYLPASARFQTFAWLWQIPCNHRFLGGIIQTRDVMSWWGPQPFQLNNCKNRVWKLVSKRREESVKELVIDHFVARTSSEWWVIGIAWQNRDIARKAESRMAMNCQSYCYGILHFVLGSHLILQRNMPCFCLFVVLKSTDV